MRKTIYHVVAKLRQILGMKQATFADLVGCSKATIQSLEPRKPRLRLSEDLAKKISAETGVEVGWLLTNDLEAEPMTIEGKPFTKKTFEQRRSKLHGRKIDPSHFGFAQLRLVNYLHRMVDLLVSSHANDNLGLACYKLDTAFSAIERDLNIPWDGGAKRPPSEREVPSEILDAMRPGVALPARFIFDKFNGSLLLEFRKKHPFKGNSKKIVMECLNPCVITQEEFKKAPLPSEF